MRPPALRVHIGVGGRFHADHFTRALLGAGCDAHLWTSLPHRSLGDLPVAQCHSFPSSEILYRALKGCGAERIGEWGKMVLFGRQLAHALRRRPADVFVGWSCFSLETLRRASHRRKILVRDSAHIATQIDIVESEYTRLGQRFGSRQHTIERETEEYQLADTIVVLSDFARQSFLARGIAEDKLRVLRLGVDTTRFTPGALRDGKGPLKAIYFGAISVRKGVHHLLDAVAGFAPRDLQLTLIGPPDRTLSRLVRRYPQVRVFGPRPQAALIPFLQDNDVFVMPTIEDGFGQTVIQAMASGLVPIATDRCGAAECIEEGVSGFRVTAGDSAALRDKLGELAEDRKQLPALRAAAIETARRQTWAAYTGTVANWAAEWADRDQMRPSLLTLA